MFAQLSIRFWDQFFVPNYKVFNEEAYSKKTPGISRGITLRKSKDAH